MKTPQVTKYQNDELPRLYPTFKEWKRFITVEVVTSLDVYILPLRNENGNTSITVKSSDGSLYPTFKEWKPSILR